MRDRIANARNSAALGSSIATIHDQRDDGRSAEARRSIEQSDKRKRKGRRDREKENIANTVRRFGAL